MTDLEGCDRDGLSCVMALLVDECEERGWSLDSLALRMGGDAGMWRLTLDFMFACDDDPQCRMGERTAAGLGRAFGTSASLWSNLEKSRLRALEGSPVLTYAALAQAQREYIRALEREIHSLMPLAATHGHVGSKERYELGATLRERIAVLESKLAATDAPDVLAAVAELMTIPKHDARCQHLALDAGKPCTCGLENLLAPLRAYGFGGEGEVS